MFAYGALGFAAVVGLGRLLRRPRLALHLRALAFAIGLGVAVAPGHGEIIIVPVLALLLKGGSAMVYGLAAVFALPAWMLAVVLLSWSARRRKGDGGN